MSAVVLLSPGPDTSESPKELAFVEVTKVRFHHLSTEAIEAYIATGEPFDKAGGYGVQGIASSFCAGLEGCYFNVVGFPQARFCQEVISSILEENL